MTAPRRLRLGTMEDEAMDWAQTGRIDGEERARTQRMEPRAARSANALAAEALEELRHRINRNGQRMLTTFPLDIAEACAYLTEFQYGYLTAWNTALSEATR